VPQPELKIKDHHQAARRNLNDHAKFNTSATPAFALAA
jgi:hypothetical protein